MPRRVRRRPLLQISLQRTRPFRQQRGLQNTAAPAPLLSTTAACVCPVLLGPSLLRLAQQAARPAYQAARVMPRARIALSAQRRPISPTSARRAALRAPWVGSLLLTGHPARRLAFLR